MEKRFRAFTVLITKLYRDIRRIKTGEMQEYGLGNAHVSCLYYLYTEQALTAKELMDICHEDKASLSRAIAHLEADGLIHCDSSLKKRYNSAFRLTEKGKVVAKNISDKVYEILDFASNGLSEENRESMYEGLRLVSHNLDEYCNKYEGEQ